jgi:L-glyceraldehyde 3-phosphate reductase
MTLPTKTGRYDDMKYRQSGNSGLKLPVISLGLWQNFGDLTPFESQRAILHRAFELGITHFDLANNYGPPLGAAEENFGRHLREEFKSHRDEIVVSTKAGYPMWDGPYGDGGSRKYIIASLDQSLQRLGLDYVDIVYAHRAVTSAPLEETMGALHTAVESGRALYVGISSYSPERTRKAATILHEMGTPLLIHQPSYSMFNRWIEPELLSTLSDLGVGCIPFSSLAQGLLTSKYVNSVPAESRIAKGDSADGSMLTPAVLSRIRSLQEIAASRGQSLAQMALAWVLRNKAVTSTLVGASSVVQLEENVKAVANLSFSEEELSEIDKYAVDSGINLQDWAESATLK